MKNFKTYLAALLCNLGISANFLTFLGVATAGLASFYIYQGQFFLAGSLLLLAGGLDLMDGAVARLSGKAGVFGGILDSSLDRYADGAVLGAVVLFYATQDQLIYAILALSAIIGSFSISYVRARAECEIETCRIGFWERGERIVFLAIGLLFNNLAVIICVLGIFTHFTVFYRLYYSRNYQSLPAPETRSVNWRNFFTDTRRSSPFYFVKLLVLIVLALFVRLPR